MRNRLYALTAIPFIVLLFGALTLIGAGVTRTASVQAQGTTFYVDDDNCPATGSGTQLDPYCSIQDAVDAASAGDEIRVAEGSYTGAQTLVFAPWGGEASYSYTQVVLITKGITLTGGYEPSDWETSAPANNPTVIDAEGYGRGISVVTPGGPVTVDGFTITGGDYTGLGNPPDGGYTVCRAGGGIDCGGGVYAFSSVFTLRNSVVTGNVASRDRGVGGGIYLWETYGNEIEDTTVSSNSARGSFGGGGMYADRINEPLTISGCTFQDNYGAAGGGGLALYDAYGLVTIEETDFLNNTATTEEGGGAQILLTDNGEILRMDRVRFQGNEVQERAAALFIHAAGPVIPKARLTNLMFVGNGTTGTTASDAVIGIDGAFTSLGVNLAHVTAADNQAPSFLYAEPSRYAGKSLTVTLTNTLAAGFTYGFAAEEPGDGEALIRHVNTLADDVTTLHQTVGGTPIFEAVNPLTGDPKLDGAHHLQIGSAAIDAGIEAGVATDIDGDHRPQGVAPDVGADEYVFNEAPATVTISGPGTVIAQTSTPFVAEVSPDTATLPITYTWQATGLPAVTHAGGGLSDTVHLSWPTPGAKTITVMATNAQGSASDSFSVNVTGDPVLHIAKSAPVEARAGDLITYTLTVTNTGVADAQDLVVTDVLPTGASYVAGGSLVGNEVQWALASLAGNGGVAEVTFVVTATQTITNQVYAVSARGGHGATGAVPVVTVVGAPDLSITKTGPYSVGFGETIEYELTVTNRGTVAASDLTITDVLPAGANYVSGGTLVGKEVRWERDSLAARGGQARVSFSVTAAQTIVNQEYGVTARGGFGAVGDTPVQTVVGEGTRYVAPGGMDGPNNCTDSSSPCATLQHAVNVALAGEEVRVAAGTYTGAKTVSFAPWGGEASYSYTQVVLITKGLTLRGGYERGDWSTSSPAENLTVIDAQGYGRGISVVTPGGPVTVDGFTITGGDYTGLGNPPDGGHTVCRADGGIDCGGGVYAFGSVFTLRNSVVTGNVASRNRGVGGGTYLWEAYGSHIENVTVSSNSALGSFGGGGMYADRINEPLTISGCTFQDNDADGSGGGLVLYDAYGLVTIEETDFLNNTASTDEGGGAQILLTDNGEILRMDRVRFEGNQAYDRAAALFIHAAGNVTPHARVTNLVFGGNGTTGTTASDAVIGIDGAFTNLGVNLAHVTAADNGAPTFLYAEPSRDPGEQVTVTLANALVTGFTYGFAAGEAGGDVLIRHVNTLVDDVTTLHRTVSGSPTFEAVNTLSGDPGLDENYRLEAGSGAIDAGVDAGVTTDIDGQTRPYGAEVDIGADEFIPVAAESVSIAGPTTGFVGRSYAFEAVVSPPTATGPITYNWSPEPEEGQGSYRAVYRWTTEGAKSVAVTATSPLGTTPSASHGITVELLRVYLPLVTKQ